MQSNYFTIYKSENFFDFQEDLIKLIYDDKNGKSKDKIFKTDYFSKDKGEWFNLFKDKVLKKFSKKVDRWADKEAGKMIKQMNSPKAIEKAKGYAKLSPAVGIGVATSDPVQEARKKKKLKRSK